MEGSGISVPQLLKAGLEVRERSCVLLTQAVVDEAVDGGGQGVHRFPAFGSCCVLQGGSFLCQGGEQGQADCLRHLCSSSSSMGSQ